VLDVEAIHTYYGDSHVLHGVSLRVAAGEAVALLGRNGAGKTTAIRSIVGFTPPRAGRVVFEGRAIEHWPSYRIARSGLALVPQGRRIFAPLSVREIGRILLALKAERLSLLLVEQNYHLALRVVDRVYVMNKGQIVYEGTPAGLEADEEVKRRYLGVA